MCGALVVHIQIPLKCNILWAYHQIQSRAKFGDHAGIEPPLGRGPLPVWYLGVAMDFFRRILANPGHASTAESQLEAD